MLIRVRRGLEANRLSYTPQAGEPTYTTDTKKLYIGGGGGSTNRSVGGSSADKTTKDTGSATTGISVDSNSAAGASSAHTNIQPSLVVYMWERTA